MITYDDMVTTTRLFSFRGLSSDVKPTGEYDGYEISDNSSFLETDTFKLYFYNATTQTWATKS